jgi:hypothetical protein
MPVPRENGGSFVVIAAFREGLVTAASFRPAGVISFKSAALLECSTLPEKLHAPAKPHKLSIRHPERKSVLSETEIL